MGQNGRNNSPGFLTILAALGGLGGLGGIAAVFTAVLTSIPVIEFSASATTIESGQPVTITWTATNTQKVEIQPFIGVVAASGSRTMPLEETTFFEVRATGNLGITATASHQVQVERLPLPADGTIADPDDDGIVGRTDECPDEAGPPANDGCPIKPTEVASSSVGESPIDFIHTYYAEIEKRNYDFTWSHLTKLFLNRWNCPEEYNNDLDVDDYVCNLPPFADYDFVSYTNWWDSVKQIDVTKADLYCQDRNIAVVIISLDYTYQSGGGLTQENRYAKLLNVDGEWHFHDVGSDRRTCVFTPNG